MSKKKIKKPTWILITVKAKDIIPNPRNAKKTTDSGFKKLQKSLDTFGIVFDGICNKDLSLIDGHSRLLLKKPDEDCRVFVPDRQLSEEEYKLFNLIFDYAKAGEIDYDIVHEDYDTEELEEYGIEMPSEKKGFFQKYNPEHFGLDRDEEIENEEIKKQSQYPITIVVNVEQYMKWQQIKDKYSEQDDLKVFLMVLKKAK